MLIKLLFRNLFRHRLRTLLTALGVCVALFAFTMIRTMLAAWYAGVEATAKDRLITRNAVSLIFMLPRSYLPSIAAVEKVKQVGYGNWFGAQSKDENFFFAQFAIDDNYLNLYPEVIISPEEREAFFSDRRGALIGKDVADHLSLKPGDVIQLQGTIYPGLWEFNVRGIFSQTTSADTRNMFFHWEYLNERVREEDLPGPAPDQVGFYVEQLEPGANVAEVAQAIDVRFSNSYAETLTETETAFVQGFISMSSMIILALDAISFVVIVIMLLVLTNTMLMAARERYREISILKALGFGRRELVLLLVGESGLTCILGLLLLAAALIPIFTLPPRTVLGPLFTFFPVFELDPNTVLSVLIITVIVALISGLAPARSVLALKVTEGLRRVG